MALVDVRLILQDGLVYAVEFSHRSGRDLLNVAKKRQNVIPIIEDARHPHKYRMLMGSFLFTFSQRQCVYTFAGMVDCIFSDVAQPDQARIVALNAQMYLKDGGYVVISIKVRSALCLIACKIRRFAGELYRFDRRAGGSLCWRSEQAERVADQAERAGHGCFEHCVLRMQTTELYR